MSAKVEYRQNEISVFLDGEIDHHSASIIRTSVDDAILKRRPETLILDFGGVTFMDSSGIGLVMGRYRQVSANGKALRVINLSERDYKIMKMSGIEKLARVSKKGELK